jgi:hypothetical protein
MTNGPLPATPKEQRWALGGGTAWLLAADWAKEWNGDRLRTTCKSIKKC